MKKLALFVALTITLITGNAMACETCKGRVVSMKATPQGELKANTTTKILVNFKDTKTGAPIGENELLIAHTKKVHLLIIDPTLTDYQHIHPTPTANPGEFSFDFTPKKDGLYKIWADLKPVKSGNQEYVTEVIGQASGKEEISKSVNNDADVDGYKFKLIFDSTLTAEKASLGNLKVEDKDGKPVTKLEPVLGAFAHIVGFSEDFNTVVHIHPMGVEPASDSARGGPELQFHIEPATTGFVKLFAQVKIDGKDIFVPFGLNVGNALAENAAEHAH